MPADVALLVATALLAVVAVAAAVVAVRSVRRAATVPPAPAGPTAGPTTEVVAREPRLAVLEPYEPDRLPVHRPEELQPRIVEGRVVVPPTRDQVVATAMSRPQTRVAVVAHGVAHALRPESRDRIAALVRRAYRERRRERLRAGRRAARASHPTTAEADRWLGELP